METETLTSFMSRDTFLCLDDKTAVFSLFPELTFTIAYNDSTAFTVNLPSEVGPCVILRYLDYTKIRRTMVANHRSYDGWHGYQPCLVIYHR